VFSSRSLPPPGSFRHPWSRRKDFHRRREVERLAVTVRPNRSRYQSLTPLSLYSLPAALSLPRLAALSSTCPAGLPAQLSVPTRGSAARLAPLRKLPAVILAVAVCPVQAVNRPAYQRQFISITSTHNPIVSPHSAAAPLKWPVSILVSSCFAVSLHAEVWLLHPLKHRVRDRSPGHLIPYFVPLYPYSISILYRILCPIIS
jgi:hypothetical protein